ncbi:MAG TPA: lysophospholipid acyltransferase family protein [Treponemataceae bacterium]|nr:lysophospholipid acyltransferase family protein [Treponemataceae bacterium]
MKVLLRHQIVVRTASPLCRILAQVLFGYKAERYGSGDRPCLVLSNHVSMLDPIFVGLSFKFPLYYVAADDVFKKRFWSRLLVWLMSPIPKIKGMSDLTTVREMVSAVKQGGSVCLFPNGNTSYSGDEQHIMKGIGRLVKLLKITLVLYNLEGLYGVDPRWGNRLRRGKSYGRIRKVLSYEEYKDIPHEEFDNLIQNFLSVSARKETSLPLRYKSRHKAEYMERAFFLCPDCQRTGTLRSSGDSISCSACGYALEYKEDLSFKLLSGNNAVCDTKELYDYQVSFMNNLSEEIIKNLLPLTSHNEVFGEEIRGKPNLVHMKKASITLTWNDFTISDGKQTSVFLLDDIQGFAIHGRNKLLFFTDTSYYFLHGEKRRNALQFLYYFYTIKRLKGRNEDGFLGI